MPDPTQRIVIAGGGVAGLEALIALHDIASHRVDLTLLSPTDEFLVRALSVGTPFARPEPRRYGLRRICADQNAAFHSGALASVDPVARVVHTSGGDELPYDALLVAVGANAAPAFEHALTFRGMQDAEAMHGLIQDVEGGYVSRIAFVVPPGTTWPLPIYELALLMAERADSMSMDVQLSIVTPESEPLEIFGTEASRQVDELLAQRGIVLRTGCHVTDVRDGAVMTGSAQPEVKAQRVVALPRLSGPRVPGLPADDGGFIPVDEHGHVAGSVWAAGDGTTAPIKQGGLAAQQAFSAALSIAAQAGADVTPRAFRPVLRAELLAGTHATSLRRHVAVGAGLDDSTATDHTLWWPPTKIAAPHLAPYLSAVDEL